MKIPLRLAILALCFCMFPVAQARMLPEKDMKTFTQSRRTLRQQVRQTAALHLRKKLTRLVPLTQQFENTDLGVSIRYPAGWERKDLMQHEQDLLLAVMFLSPVSAGDTVRENINLVLEAVEADMTLNEYTRLGLEKEQELFQDFHLMGSGRTEVAGQAAQRVMFSASTSELAMTFQQVWFFHRGRAHVWTFADETKNYAAHVRVFEAMLESLIVK